MISDTEITNNPMIVFKYFATTVGGQEVGLLQTDVKMPSDNSKVISTNTLIGDNNHYLYFAPQNNETHFRISYCFIVQSTKILFHLNF